MEDDLGGVYLKGDPNTESTRRHMERVLSGDAPRRWPWLIGLVAGGTALAVWQLRRARRANGGSSAGPDGAERLAPRSGPAGQELRERLSRAGGR
jgi:hypothetical protein